MGGLVWPAALQLGQQIHLAGRQREVFTQCPDQHKRLCVWCMTQTHDAVLTVPSLCEAPGMPALAHETPAQRQPAPCPLRRTRKGYGSAKVPSASHVHMPLFVASTICQGSLSGPALPHGTLSTASCCSPTPARLQIGSHNPTTQYNGYVNCTSIRPNSAGDGRALVSTNASSGQSTAATSGAWGLHFTRMQLHLHARGTARA